jgi:hypothetical protein
MNDLNQAVINLHDIARLVEGDVGIGQLSIDIRKCADRLTVLINPIKISENTAKGDQ